MLYKLVDFVDVVYHGESGLTNYKVCAFTYKHVGRVEGCLLLVFNTASESSRCTLSAP